ncbi:MAG: uracil-DNA glycosylase [Anaerolineae bacterium]|nr:uracil-DNA glycosylase [Anaerolineae bacterium]MDW8072244.1 uracil-DNA glycosylase [Anaerolineae bacterium]
MFIASCEDGIRRDASTPSEWQRLVAEIVQCRRCPRLVGWREQVAREKRSAYKDWHYWGRPVPGFGDRQARTLIVGLAPGAHGSNRTGRMFTGDRSGDTLYAALYRAGFANQPDATHCADGLMLHDAFITAIVRCAPPANRPNQDEIAACYPFLTREWRLLPNTQVVLALGQLAFRTCCRLLRQEGYVLPRLQFRHALHYAARHNDAGRTIHLLASYHPSQQNTQTGRLTPQMLDAVLHQARAALEDGWEAGEIQEDV